MALLALPCFIASPYVGSCLRGLLPCHGMGWGERESCRLGQVPSLAALWRSGVVAVGAGRCWSRRGGVGGKGLGASVL